MVYLDYSATTQVDKEVLESFNKTCLDFIGNPNSLHKLGVMARNLESQATKQIAELLNVDFNSIIYTSGATEANNTAIKGICYKYQNRGKHIITTKLEHSSVNETLSFLEKQGFIIDYVETDEFGLVTIDNLKKIMRDDTILVCINWVNSETGVKQPIEKIGEFLKNTKAFFHVDATQIIGKQKVSLENIDTCSISAHKFYGLKGIGLLIKKPSISLEPLIHGGKSTTKYRSGTPALPLIVSISKALRLALNDIDKKYLKVKENNTYLKEHLKNYPNLFINSNIYSIPHILNISVLNIKPETLLHALENEDIYVSTGSACSSGSGINQAILEVTKSEKQASFGIRISLSSLTTQKELDYFLEKFAEIYQKLELKNAD